MLTRTTLPPPSSVSVRCYYWSKYNHKHFVFLRIATSSCDFIHSFGHQWGNESRSNWSHLHLLWSVSTNQKHGLQDERFKCVNVTFLIRIVYLCWSTSKGEMFGFTLCRSGASRLTLSGSELVSWNTQQTDHQTDPTRSQELTHRAFGSILLMPPSLRNSRLTYMSLLPPLWYTHISIWSHIEITDPQTTLFKGSTAAVDLTLVYVMLF